MSRMGNPPRPSPSSLTMITSTQSNQATGSKSPESTEHKAGESLSNTGHSKAFSKPTSTSSPSTKRQTPVTPWRRIPPISESTTRSTSPRISRPSSSGSRRTSTESMTSWSDPLPPASGKTRTSKRESSASFSAELSRSSRNPGRAGSARRSISS